MLAYDATWLLDVCCRTGAFARDLIREARVRGRRFEVVALDADDGALAEAAAAGDDPLLRFVRGDARRLPFPDASFDLATCCFAMHAFDPDDAIAVMSEMRRVARTTPLVYERERSRGAALWAATIGRFGPSGRQSHDGSIARRTYTAAELADFAGLAGWRTPVATRGARLECALHDAG